MTLSEIDSLLDEIRWAAGRDDEVAHKLEDDLFRTFVRYVSDGGVDEIRMKARAVMKSRDIHFNRHCA
jgi:hypothetical protein